MRLLRKKRVQTALGIAFSLILLEILVRVALKVAGTNRATLSDYYGVARDARLGFSGGMSRYVEHPYLIYRVRGQDTEFTDDWGINVFGPSDPDASEDDTFTVLTVGGSTTDSPYPQHLYEYLHEKMPDKSIKVVGAGVAAWTSAEILLNVELRGLEYHPDLIVFYEAYNDIYPSCTTVDFQADYSHWRIPYPKIQPLIFDYVPPVFDVSATYVILRHLLTFNANRNILYGTGVFTRNGYPDFANCSFMGKETFRRNVISLIGVAQIHNIEMLLVTQAQIVHTPGSTTEERMVEAARANDDVVREVAQAYPVHFLDFDKFIEPRRKELMRRDLVHFDDDGYQVLAQSIGDKIIEDFFPENADGQS